MLHCIDKVRNISNTEKSYGFNAPDQKIALICNLASLSIVQFDILHIINLMIEGIFFVFLLQNMFRQQQKVFQQARIVQSQRLKTIKQLYEQFLKVMYMHFVFFNSKWYL